MRIKITINTDDFVEQAAGDETARILRGLADRLKTWPGKNEFVIGLYDVNGNRVGESEAIFS